jgi:hypothetical protein
VEDRPEPAETPVDVDVAAAHRQALQQLRATAEWSAALITRQNLAAAKAKAGPVPPSAEPDPADEIILSDTEESEAA